MTTDGVIAGTVAALSLISINCVSTNITEMCRKIGASHSAVMVQIRNKILPILNISGFTTLAESKRLITRELLGMVVGLQDLPDYPHGSKRKSIW
ncbi:hypothetical protein LCGC14_2160780 [marine sediment metagenome]|uniref:Uncharacterized protein n=1 Tax=marine sediment metagenome TaxID=412755 RepID=A0A0F9DSP8_9ZZZZ